MLSHPELVIEVIRAAAKAIQGSSAKQTHSFPPRGKLRPMLSHPELVIEVIRAAAKAIQGSSAKQTHSFPPRGKLRVSGQASASG